MSQKKIIYYVAFPAFIFLLCVFTYQLGFKRGISHSKKEQITKVLDELEKTEGDSEDSKLTYYQELHDEKNPIVEQVNSNQTKPTTPQTKTTVPATTNTTTTAATSKPQTKPATATTSSETTSIQVGAFTDLGKADELIDRLKNSGFDAYTKPVQSKGNELFRVLVKSSKADASATQSKLTKQGFKNTFVVTK